MNIHEAYLRKQAVAVESVHGKGYAADLLAAADEIGRLEAIVEKLPVTADGVPVVPYVDEVWLPDPVTRCRLSYSQPVTGEWVHPMNVRIAYSTREAAEAARHADGGE